MQNITTTKMSVTDKIILNHNTAIGLQAGFSLKVTELPQGLVILEGSPVTAPVDGIRSLCKFAKITKVEAGVVYVKGETNPFKVGDIVLYKENSVAAAITAMSVDVVDPTLHKVTVALGDDVAVGDFLALATAASSTTSKKAQVADVICKFHTKIEGTNYVLFDLAAYTQVVQLAEGYIPPVFLEDLKAYAIREIKY